MNNTNELIQMVHEQMRRRHRENIYFSGGWIAAAVIPAIMLTMIYIMCGVVPFGSKLLVCDANRIWFEHFDRFRNALLGNGSLFYSMDGGLGGEIYSDFRHGFFSPFSLLSVAFTSFGLSECLVLMTILRSALAGMFSYLLFLQFSERNALASLAVSTGYASGTLFSLSFLAPQFADAAVFLPLAALGVTLLSKRSSVLPLFFGMTFFLLTTPSLWPVMTIFCLVLFIWSNLIFKPKNVGMRTGMLLFCAAIAVGVDAVVIVPSLVADIELNKVFFSSALTDHAAFSDVITALLGGFTPENGVCTPLIFCSSLPALLVPVYFTTNRISLIERQTSGFFMLFVLLSMMITPLASVWLCFSAPTGSVVAFSCAGSLIATVMCSRLCSQEESFKASRMIGSWLFWLAVFSLCALLGGGGFTLIGWIFSAAFLTLTAAVAMAALAGRKQKLGLYFMLLFIICFDCVAGGMLSISGALKALPADTQEQAAVEYAAMSTMNNLIINNENGRSNDFRVRGAVLEGRNCIDAPSNDTPSTVQLTDALGIKGSMGHTPVTDCLFGVRYAVLDHNDSEYKPLGMNGGYYMNYNRSALKLAFPADNTAKGLTTYSTDPFVSQNLLVTAIAGAERELFVNSEITLQQGHGCTISTTTTGTEVIRSQESAYVEYRILVPTSGTLYMYANETRHACENIAVNKAQLGVVRLDCINRLGVFERGDEVTVYISVTNDRLAIDGIWFATLAKSLTDAALGELAQRPCTCELSGDTLTVTASVADSQFLMTTIPWRSGWSVTVDGVKKNTICAAGSFLGVETGSGVHTVVFRYTPSDMTGAIIISLLSFMVGFLFVLMVENSRRKAEDAATRPSFSPDYPPQELDNYADIPEYYGAPFEYAPPPPEPFYDDIIPELVADDLTITDEYGYFYDDRE